MKLGKKINNLGLSLVELLVTIAIIAIVGGAITSFIVVAQRNYTQGSAETDIQTEAQLVSNQLRELMIDTARGISYSYNSDYMDADAFELIDDSSLPDDYVTKSLYIYDSDKYFELIWDTDKRQIFYQEYGKDESPASISEADLASRKVLANNVSNFSVDLSSIKSDRTVAFTITMQRDAAGRVYSTSHKVKLRNEVLINAPRDDIYDEDEPGDTTPTKIVIGPSRLYAWPGTDTVLSAIVTSDDGGVPSQSVVWKLEGASAIGDDGTNVNNNTNVLHLSLNERGTAPGNTFTITASKSVVSQTEPPVVSTIESLNTINTYVRVIKDIYGTNESNGFLPLDEYTGDAKWSVKTGEDCTFTAEIFGENLYTTGLDGETLIPLTTADMGGAQISVISGADYLVSDSLVYDLDNGTFKFKVKEAADSVFAGFDWEQGSPTFTLRVQVVKAPYTTVYRDIIYKIRKPEPMSVVVDSFGRNGVMNIELGGAKFDDYVETDSHGKTTLKDGYYRNIAYVVVHSDGSKSQTYQISDAGNHGVGMDTNGPLTVKITEGDVYKFSAYLRPNFFAYSGKFYYAYHENQNWMAASDNSDSITDVDYILMTVTIGDLIGEAKIEVDPVIFNYSVANPYNDTDAKWNSVSQILYVTPDDTVSNHAYKMHFKFTGGWADGTDYAFNDFRPNNNYQAGGIYPENGLARYSGIATKKNSTTSYRYDLGVASDAQGFGKMLIDSSTGENDKGESSASKKPTVTFTVPSDKATLQSLADDGVIVKEIYEYNPWFDRKDSNGQTVGYGSNYGNVTGCEGIAEFRFVNKNVFLAANSKSDDPVSWYCPTYDEIRNGFIETNGSRTGYYYYITEVCRYFVSKAGDEYRAIYETYDGKTWNSGLHLKYYAKDADHSVAGWYEFNQNIELKYYQYQTPSTLYLPTYEELSKQGVQRYDTGYFDDLGRRRGYFYTYGVDNERFFVFKYNGTCYARFEYYNDAQGRWLTDDGESSENDLYLLTYDEKDQVWRDSYPDNIDITYTNRHPEPMQLYLPYYNYFRYSGLQAETHTVLEGGSKTGYYYYPQNGQERFFVYYENGSHADYEVKSGDSWTALYTLDYTSNDYWKDREPVNIYITNSANNTSNDILNYTKYCYTYQEAKELRASGANVIGSINDFEYLDRKYQAYTYQVNNINRMVLIDLGESYSNRYVAVHQYRNNGNSNTWRNRCYYYYITDSNGAGWYDRNWSSGVDEDSYDLIVLRLPTYNELVAQGYSTNDSRQIYGNDYTGIIYPVRNMEDNTNNNDEYFLVYSYYNYYYYAFYFRGNTFRRYYTWNNGNSRWN